MCEKCSSVRALIRHAGSEWGQNDDIITLKGEPFMYFRHRNDGSHDANVIGFGLQDVEPGTGSIPKNKISYELLRIAYG